MKKKIIRVFEYYTVLCKIFEKIRYIDIVFEMVNFADPRNRFPPLVWAVLQNDSNLADLLLTCGANIEISNPLKKAVVWRRIRCAEVLIRHGADRLQRDSEGRIPFEYVFQKQRSPTDENEPLSVRVQRVVRSCPTTDAGIVLEDDLAFLGELTKPTGEELKNMKQAEETTRTPPIIR